MITLLDDQLKKLNPADSSSIPTPGSTEAERIYETAIGLRHSPTPPTRRSVLQSTDPVRFFSRRAVRRVTAVLVAAAIVAVFLAPLPSLHLFGTGATGGHVSKLGPCESRWIEVRAWLASPLPAGPNNPPTRMHEVVRVDSSGRTCMLPAGWPRLTSIRQQGTPYASVHQTDVGHSSSVALSAGGFAIASVSLTVPWLIPYSNLCASAVSIGVTPPGSGRTSRAFWISTGCGDHSAGVLRATVGAFHPINSGVPGAKGALVAHLQPGPMVLGPKGVLYISEPSLDQVVARLPDGSFKLIAGTGRAGYSGDGGPAVRGRLRQPEGLAVASDGTLYIADFGNNRVREVLPDGTIETVAGAGGTQPNETIPIDGFPGGPALKAHIWSPAAIAIGRGGVLYIAAFNENAVVELHDGVITTVVTGDNLRSIPYFAQYQLCQPGGLVLDARGDLYFDCDGGLVLMRTPGGRIASRGSWESRGFAPTGAPGGDTVDVLTTAGIVSFTPTGRQTIRLPAVLARVGVLDLEGITATSDGTVYLDQSGDYGPPAIVALRKGRLTTLWAADT
ncbi:MAG: hypothetical protein WAV54_02575 [Acidimicrobiales bacterium]